MTFDADCASASEWAQLYRSRGIQVVPCNGKIPFLKSWKEYQNELVPEATFERWYGPHGLYATTSNMGMLTGIASGHVLMIDLDAYKPGGTAALNWWRGVLAIHNNNMLLETWEQITGGGGFQLFFRYPASWKGAVNAKTDIHIDIRGQGGFAVLPPSLHASGRHYEWREGRAPWQIELLEAPLWLLEEIEKLIREHGGGKGMIATGINTQPSYPSEQTQYDGFGHLRDSREDKMYRLIWGAVIDWYRERPTKPSEYESMAMMATKYLVYQDLVTSRLHDPTQSKMDLLDQEGRGPEMFHVKWQRAMSLWETKVRDEANIVSYDAKQQFEQTPPGKEQNQSGPLVTPISGPLPEINKSPPIEWLDMSNWDNIPVPTRKWAIQDRVPLNQVGLFSGEGGAGKSLIELMKNVAHVTGQDWLGSMPEQGGAFYLGAEDEAEEIHIRLAAIAKHYKTTFKELTANGLRVLPLLGKDSMLCVPTGRGNHIEVTPLYRQLYEAAGDLKPKNISIDTLSRAFGGDEINRVQVYAFAMHMQALAKVARGSVTILSHPSLAGIATGTGISGSTAWHGAFRFRQYLKGIKAEEDADPSDDDLRELVFKKNQYGPSERPIILRYKDGLFLPVNGTSDPERVAREAKVDGFFIKMLRQFRERDERVTHHPSSPLYYAPTMFANSIEAKQQGIRKGELEDAMKRLMSGNRVLTEKFKVNGREFSRVVLAPGT